MWTPSQRGVLIAFVLILSTVLLIRLAVNRHYVSDPQPVRPDRHEELADRLDPNVASWQELAVLPQLGEKRAREIVAYRDQFRADRRGGAAFSKAEDLLVVKGIGVALLNTIRPHLIFPAPQPTTRAL
jgi:DNA uptake protein ComE-like DNA-binding protein